MTTDARLRDDARACFAAALEAVDPAHLVAQALDRTPDLPATGPVHVVAVGKAAPAMARSAIARLGPRVVGGVLIAPDPLPDGPAPIRRYAGGHPVPNDEGRRGAEAVATLARSLGAEDVLLCLLSGGGSALMTLPAPGLSVADVRDTTRVLLEAGATIDELNTVRKHIDQLKGGRLALLAAPARVVTLVLSDVLGDRIDVIASGPVSADPTTYDEALALLDRRGVRAIVPVPVVAHLMAGVRGEVPETPTADDLATARVTVAVIGHIRLAAAAAAAEATRRGYHAQVLTTTSSGEARAVGADLAALARDITIRRYPITPPACIVTGGETTVTVRGSGRGGRNQEIALGAALGLDGGRPALIASMGTDGIDGHSHAAGAFADHTTIARAASQRLDAADYLHRNDSTAFFQALDDLLVTGPTGTNVMDLQLVIVPA